MVIELIIDYITAEKKPWEILFLGFFYTSVAIVLSLWIFQKYASIVMVFLTVLAAFPLVFNATKWEEKKDLETKSELSLMKQHSFALNFFMMLFFGATVAFAIWYVFLPTTTVQDAYSIQAETLVQIANPATGHVITMTDFSRIFFNNVKVLLFSILFALIYGVGALFILIWNASVLGTAIGNFIRVNMQSAAVHEGFTQFASYMQIFSIGFAKFALHGIPEIFAYFVGGLAGGILSFAIINRDFKSPFFNRIIVDSLNLTILAIIILAIAAFIEVFITPMVF